MRIDTPKDMPTHLLTDPEQYITKVGRFLRKTSLDELPQLFNIWIGQMSVIAPRPALWNQYDLIQERDKYGVNVINPGLTGWAQINGRDELEIPIKAKLDGEYIEKLGFWMDLKCFVGTIGAILIHDGVVEGGTGELHKQDINTNAAISHKRLKKCIILGNIVLLSISIIILISIYAIVYKFNNIRVSFILDYIKISWLVSGMLVIGFTYTVYINLQRKLMLHDKSIIYSNIEEKKYNVSSNYIDDKRKKILITGANSYIGMSMEAWLKHYKDTYNVDTLDLLNAEWREYDFSNYDVVFHVADIVHKISEKTSDDQKELFYKVNTDLSIEVATKAKQAGVKQFVFMSTMSVYSGCKDKVITKNTEPKPSNYYGDSKLKAEVKLKELNKNDFKVVIIRAPMIYGKGCKGNYVDLAKLARKLPIFPIVKNKRSMIYIDNLCMFIKLMIDNFEEGVFFPQNGEYINTSDMVQMIATVNNHKILMLPFVNYFLKFIGMIPGKIGTLSKKAFGNLTYDMSMSDYKDNYRIYTLYESIKLTEGEV
jgi:nucleoside-diphosphate-sugar epimerase